MPALMPHGQLEGGGSCSHWYITGEILIYSSDTFILPEDLTLKIYVFPFSKLTNFPIPIFNILSQKEINLENNEEKRRVKDKKR